MLGRWLSAVKAIFLERKWHELAWPPLHLQEKCHRALFLKPVAFLQQSGSHRSFSEETKWQIRM